MVDKKETGIVKITLVIAGVKVEATVEQLKELKSELNKLLAEPKTEYVPYFPKPYNPYPWQNPFSWSTTYGGGLCGGLDSQKTYQIPQDLLDYKGSI